MAEVLRVLIVEDDLNSADTIVRTIKSTGFGVREQIISESSQLHKKLIEHQPDMIIHNVGIKHFPLTLSVAESHRVENPPIVIALDKYTRQGAAAPMQQGAVDLVTYQDLEHFKLVIRRTARNRLQTLELTRLRRRYRDLEKRSADLLEHSEYPIAYLHEGIHVYANKAYYELFNLNRSKDLEGLPLLDMLPPIEQDNFKLFIHDFKQKDKDEDTLEVTLYHNDVPDEYSMEFSRTIYHGEHCMRIVIRTPALKETSQLTQQLDYLAIYDIPSGLYTRSHLIEQIDKAIEQATTHHDYQSLILLKLDNYDELASKLGFAEADMLYSEVGMELRSIISLDDVLCRLDTSSYGLLTSMTDTNELDEMVNQLVEGVNDQLFEINGKSVVCHISAGVATINEHMHEAYDVISRANDTLNSATLTGQSVGLPLPTNNHEEITRKKIDQEWSERLRSAFKENRLTLTYQPLVKLPVDDHHRFAVSLQLVEPTGQRIDSNEFLPSAIRSGFARGLDRWIIINAFNALHQQTDSSQSPLFFIPLTECSVRFDEEPEWILNQIKETKANPKNIIFELHMSALLEYMSPIRKLAEAFHPLGCRFSISGYGKQEYPDNIFRHLKVDFLKVDASLINSIVQSAEQQSKLRQLVTQAHKLGKEIITPGVDDMTHYGALQNLSVDYVMGDFLQQPSETPVFNFDM